MNEKKLLFEVERRLRLHYQNPRHGNPETPVDDIVYIILSIQTEWYSYARLYDLLWQEFGSWERLLQIDVDQLASKIKLGGLHNKKAQFIKGALQKISDDFGTLTLDELSDAPDDDVLEYLKSLPGISEKSARCIMMYTMDRQVFPVDTHVWRLCRRLGLTPKLPKPGVKDQRILEEKIPPGLRYSLHVNMVSHGRDVCLTYWPKCTDCVLEDICPSKGVPDTVWGEWRSPQGHWANYVEHGISNDER